MLENGPKGEFPINWRFWTFPRDAKTVLKLRSLTRHRQKELGLTSPVADLEAEQDLLVTNTGFRASHNMINQPLVFVLPEPILKVLSKL